MEESLPAVLLALALILATAKLGGHLAIRLGQPAVLGELIAGTLLGVPGLVGVHALEFMKEDPILAAFAQIGVVLLLFEVGLESTVGQMVKMGMRALSVATFGAVASLALGSLAAYALLPGHPLLPALFLGAAVTSTSVGISARVLSDLGRSDAPEARLTLGSAVLDDVIGLIVLATATGALSDVAGGGLSLGGVAGTIAKAVVFLGGALFVGARSARRILRRASGLEGEGVLLGVSLAFCFFLSWLAVQAGLAPIIGAFAAGLILETTYYEPFIAKGEEPLERLITPVTSFLTPVFFVLMGMHVDLRALLEPTAVPLALALTLAAIAGKALCAVPVPRGIAGLPVAVGMLPRGEVTLIFASIGRGLEVDGAPIIGDAAYSALVLVVMLTTLVTPPLLTWSYRRQSA